ncbi:hypothetical protein Sjap_004782 [Stephania japonica]|uniref:Membrane-associated kinase regulator 2 n=1 Tax=Stephania japonica TaxID=461633 RepID=A0AAP0PJE8_9MAGN
MEALTLLKYFKNLSLTKQSVSTSAVELNVAPQAAQNQDQLNDDEGPFFDFEFAVPIEEDEDEDEEEDSVVGEAEAEEAEMDSTETETEREELFNLTTDDERNEGLFFNGTLLPLTDDQNQQLPINPKSPQLKVSFFKSATKFRVFTSGLKKQKPNNGSASPSSSPMKQSSSNGKSFTLKFKVEEVPIVSILTKSNKKQSNNSSEETESVAKDALLHKYFKMIKPLYVKVSKKNIDKNSTEPIKISPTQDRQSSPTAKNCEETQEGISNIKSPKQGNLQASLRVVCKHLGKSRSASSSAVAAAPSPAQPFVTRRLDDSLLQQEDGIQSAILHCKKSLNCDASNRAVAEQERPVAKEIR